MQTTEGTAETLLYNSSETLMQTRRHSTNEPITKLQPELASRVPLKNNRGTRGKASAQVLTSSD